MKNCSFVTGKNGVIYVNNVKYILIIKKFSNNGLINDSL